MRQAGLKPKSHSSGVYWVRANAKSANPNKKKDPVQEVEEAWIDRNGDGKVSFLEWLLYAPAHYASPSWPVALLTYAIIIGILAII